MLFRKKPLFPERENRELIAGQGVRLREAVEVVACRRNWTHRQLRDHQLTALQSLLTDAQANVPFYREKYRAAGFEASRLRSLEDLIAVPVVSKSELRNASLGSLKNAGHSEPVRLFSSSGSTGTPSRHYREERALWHSMARSLAIYFDWCGGKPLGNALYFIDLAPGSIDLALADLLRTTVMESQILPSSAASEELVDAVERHQPEFLSSYPSTLRNVAIAMRKRGRVWNGLRLLHLTSEMLDAGTRGLLAKVFPNARIVETYTSSEAGLIASTCPKHDDRLHIAEDGILLEIVDAEGRPTDGVGEIVVTDLTNRSTPFLCYRGLGDFGRWGPTECDCGSIFRSIRQLEGRLADSIRTPNGDWLSPFALIDAIEDLPGIFQFQIVQEHETELFVRIIPEVASSNEALRGAITRALHNLVPGIAVRVEFVRVIPSENARHKVPLVISRIPSKPS